MGVHAQEAATVPRPPAITVHRYTEDYSYLRNPENRSGAWWEALKFIPLDSAGRNYVTVGDDVLLRLEHYRNNQFGGAVEPHQSFLRFRGSPYADLHFGRALRAFGQIYGTWAIDPRSTLLPGLEDTRVDLLQGFVDWRLPLGGEASLTLRGGRQVLSFGSGRFIAPGILVRRAFDGGGVTWRAGSWRVDAILTRPVRLDADWFDDRADPAHAFWALYVTRALPRVGGKAGVDLYYLGHRAIAATFVQDTADERRHTFGARIFGARGGWTVDLEANLQTGDFAGADIRAWSVTTAVRHTFATLSMTPYLEVRANAFSGDRDPDDGTLGTFDPLYPAVRLLGEIGQVGPANLVNLRPIVGFALGSGWSATAAATFFWRQSTDDGLYGPTLTLIRPPGGSRARSIGAQGEASLDWMVNRNLNLTVAYSLFEPGRFLEQTGPAETVHFVSAQAQLRY